MPAPPASQFASLDHISQGRAGWNIVTSNSDLDARNFGREQLPDKNLRYDRADQVIEACEQLWETWEPDALRIDREAGVFADADKVRWVDYSGSLVQTRGALTTPRSPQGRPVYMQAGSSARGMDFAARWAEVVFTLQHDEQRMREFRSELRDRAERDHGRSPDSVLVLPSVEVFVDDTTDLATERAAQLDALATPEMGLEPLSQLFGVDLVGVRLDTPVSQIERVPGRGVEGATQNILARRVHGRELTLGEAALSQATTWDAPRLAGTPEEVVDRMQELFETGCCDGFVLSHAPSPEGLTRFVDLVVPELQRRGIYRDRYEGRTFRENLAR